MRIIKEVYQTNKNRLWGDLVISVLRASFVQEKEGLTAWKSKSL